MTHVSHICLLFRDKQLFIQKKRTVKIKQRGGGGSLFCFRSTFCTERDERGADEAARVTDLRRRTAARRVNMKRQEIVLIVVAPADWRRSAPFVRALRVRSGCQNNPSPNAASTVPGWTVCRGGGGGGGGVGGGATCWSELLLCYNSVKRRA